MIKFQLPLTKRQEGGQSLVELAVMLVLLLLLLQGVIDLGRAYFTYLALKDAAAEGAYFGSAYPQCKQSNSGPGCVGSNNIIYRVRESSPTGGMVDWDAADIKVSYVPSTTLQAGMIVRVDVAYAYHLITPVIGAIAGMQSITMTAQANAVIVRVPNCYYNPCR